jgi:hypothetical protein
MPDLIRQLTLSPEGYYRFITRQTFKDHLDNIMESSSTITLENRIAKQYKGNFLGLMVYYQIDSRYWYITMLLNGLESPHQYDGSNFITVPEYKQIDDLYRVVKSTFKGDGGEST